MNPVFYDHQVPGLVQKLIEFLGTSTIKNGIRKYRESLACAGPIFKEYYLKTRHPWWEPLSMFFEIQESGNSLKNYLTPALLCLARDAQMISDLQAKMPIKVREKFKRDLVDAKMPLRTYLSSI